MCWTLRLLEGCLLKFKKQRGMDLDVVAAIGGGDVVNSRGEAAGQQVKLHHPLTVPLPDGRGSNH